MDQYGLQSSAIRIQTLFRGYRVRKRIVWQIRDDLRTLMEEMDGEFSVSCMLMGYAKPQELLSWRKWEWNGQKTYEYVQLPQIKDVFFGLEYMYPVSENFSSAITTSFESPLLDTTAIDHPVHEAKETEEMIDHSVQIEYEAKEKEETSSLSSSSPATSIKSVLSQSNNLSNEDQIDMEESIISSVEVECMVELMEDSIESNEPEAVQVLEDSSKEELTYDSAELSEKSFTEELDNHVVAESQDCDKDIDANSNSEEPPMSDHEDLSVSTPNTLVELPSPTTTSEGINTEWMIQSDESLIEQITLTHSATEIQQELAWARQALADRLEYLRTHQQKKR